MNQPVVQLAQELESVCGRLAVPMKPFSSLEQLNSLSKISIERTMKILRHQSKILSERQGGIFDVEADRYDFKSALTNLDLTCTDDIIEKFQSGDIIEIYDSNFVQIHHNWVFHFYCSYDLVSLITEPVWALYSRPQEINDRIFSRAKEVIAQSDKTEGWDVPAHFLKEVKLKTPRVFKIDFKWISPLKNSKGETTAFVSTNQCTPTEFVAV